MSRASPLCILRSATLCGMNWSVPLLAPTSSTDRLRRRHASKKEMFDSFKRGRLIRRGLASRKMRRRRARSELKRNLEYRSEEHTSELQSRFDLVCRLLLEKKKKKKK